ncbi:MAG TPA: GGDEF domain-containing protein [Thermoanaerobaculia bacterium]|nr:GGDEF domain-containing protein [Thermoanaerobaculia bacterium]
MDATPGPRRLFDSSDDLSLSWGQRGTESSSSVRVPAERVREALAEVVHENLPPTVTVVGALWLLMALQEALAMGRPRDLVSVLVLGAAALVFGAASVALGRLRLPLAWVHQLALGVMLAAVVVGGIALQRHPEVRTALPLLALLPVAGVVMLHSAYFAAILALALLSWTASVAPRLSRDDLTFFVSTAAVALLVSLYVHAIRRGTLRRIAHFRLREHARRHSLQRKIDLAYQSQVELAELSIRDPLTGAYNRRYLSQVQEELERPTAHWGAVMIDLDDFKTVNDRYGHEEGDRVLQAHVHFLRRVSRAEDRLVRYGGDEFLLVVEVRSEVELQEVVHRLQSAGTVEAPAAFTVGAALRRARENLFEVIGRADDAMYESRGNEPRRRRSS